MDELWTLSDLVEEAAARIAALPAPKNGQVRPVPDDRTIRYYATLGLLDRPRSMRVAIGPGVPIRVSTQRASSSAGGAVGRRPGARREFDPQREGDPALTSTSYVARRLAARIGIPTASIPPTIPVTGQHPALRSQISSVFRSNSSHFSLK